MAMGCANQVRNATQETFFGQYLAIITVNSVLKVIKIGKPCTVEIRCTRGEGEAVIMAKLIDSNYG